MADSDRAVGPRRRRVSRGVLALVGGGLAFVGASALVLGGFLAFVFTATAATGGSGDPVTAWGAAALVGAASLLAGVVVLIVAAARDS